MRLAPILHCREGFVNSIKPTPQRPERGERSEKTERKQQPESRRVSLTEKEGTTQVSSDALDASGFNFTSRQHISQHAPTFSAAVQSPSDWKSSCELLCNALLRRDGATSSSSGDL